MDFCTAITRLGRIFKDAEGASDDDRMIHMRRLRGTGDLALLCVRTRQETEAVWKFLNALNWYSRHPGEEEHRRRVRKALSELRKLARTPHETRQGHR